MIDRNRILANLGIVKLNAMQEASAANYAECCNMVLLSPTGSGKTLAFVLPMLESLRPQSEAVQAVVVVPSRELAQQIDGVIRASKSEYRSVALYGGRPAMEEHHMLKGTKPAIVVATPGRLLDHISKGNIEAGTVTTLVIDEFDKCLELGFHDEMSEVLRKLPHLFKKVLVSATDCAEIPEFVDLTEHQHVGKGQQALIKLDYLSEDDSLEGRLELFTVLSPEKDKLGTLLRLVCTMKGESCIVFVNYREAVERVGKFLLENGVACSMFHGGMEQRDREKALYMFSNGSCNVFVSTDLASRGLDIADVGNIVHYHLPQNLEAFTHRNGRTARWDGKGQAYVILGPEEHMPEFVEGEKPEFELPEAQHKPTQPKYTTLYIGRGKKDKVNKIDIAGFLYKIGGLSKDDVGRIDVRERYSFVAVSRKKFRQLMNLIRGEKIKGQRTLFEEAK